MRKVVKVVYISVFLLLSMTALFGCGRTSYSTARLSSVGAEATEEVVNDNRKLFEDSHFQVDVQFGLDGVVKANTYMPVTLHIKNLGGDFDGTARIIMPENNSNRDGIAYEKSLMLAEQADKTVVIPVPSVSSMTYFYIELVDHDTSKVVMTKKVRTGSEQMENKVLVGVLSEDANALAYFDSRTFIRKNNSFSTHMVNLNTLTFPEDKDSLSSLSYLIINQFNTQNLSKEQMNAMISWVEQGGILILGTGADYHKVLSGFPEEFLSGSVGSISKVKTDFTSKEDAGVPVSLPVLDLTIHKAAAENKLLKEIPVSSLESSSGLVVVIPFDLGSQKISEWNKKGTLAVHILEQYATAASDRALQYMVNQYGDGMWALSNVLNLNHGIQMPKSIVYIILFIVYVLIIGPIGYFILKRLDKREWVWILIPTVAFLFYGVLFFASTDSRVHKPVATALTTVELKKQEQKETVFISLMNPNGKGYDFTIDPKYSMVSPLLIDNNYYYGDSRNNENYNYRYSIESGSNGTKVRMQPAKAFSRERMSFDYVNTTNPGTFRVSLKAATDSIRGSIRNDSGYDLTDAIFYYNGQYKKIGDFNKGESVTIGSDEMEVCNYNDLPSTIFAEDGSKVEPDVQIRRTEKRYIYQYFVADYLQMLTGSNGYVFGVAKNGNDDYYTESSIKVSGNTLVYQEIPITLSDVGDYYSSDINRDLMVDIQGDADLYSGYLYGNSAEVTYQLPKGVVLDRLIEAKSSFAGDIYAKNQKNGQYELIFKDGETEVTAKEMEKYLSDEQTFQLKYEQSAGNSRNVLPRISLTGGLR